MEFLKLKPKSFGLDFSDLSLKIANLNKKGHFLSLASWGRTEIRPGIIENGEIKEPEALINIIKDCPTKVEGKKIKNKNLVASLPENRAFLQVIRMPKMEKEELKKAVPFEAENYIPLPIDEVYLDFEVVPSVENYADRHIDVLIAAIPKKTVDLYVSCIKEAGFCPQALEIESQSSIRALIKNGVTSQPVLLIDFGLKKTSFIIFSGHSLRFTSSISVSTYKFTEAISLFLKVDMIEAEKLKIRYGLSPFFNKKRNSSAVESSKRKKRIEPNKIFEAMRPVLTDLSQQIKKYLDYYKTHTKDRKLRKVERCLLSGGGANLKGLDNFLSSELKISVELGNPWVNILPAPLKEIPELPFKESLSYTSALGLALRGIQGE